MNVLDWLKSSSGDGKIVLQRLAELFAVNAGQFVVSDWGNVARGVGAYGRMGLTQNEALELLYTSGILTGLLMAENNQNAGFVKEIIQAEIERVQEEKKNGT